MPQHLLGNHSLYHIIKCKRHFRFEKCLDVCQAIETSTEKYISDGYYAKKGNNEDIKSLVCCFELFLEDVFLVLF